MWGRCRGLRETCSPANILMQGLQGEPKPLFHSTEGVCIAPVCNKPFQRTRNLVSKAIKFHCLETLGQLLCMQNESYNN